MRMLIRAVTVESQRLLRSKSLVQLSAFLHKASHMFKIKLRHEGKKEKKRFRLGMVSYFGWKIPEQTFLMSRNGHKHVEWFI